MEKSTLVVIDDQAEIRDFVIAIARSAGYEACGVADAGDWLETMQISPDIIILDLMMPGLDGIEVLRKLAEGNHGSRIVLSSAHPVRVLEASARLASALGLKVIGQLPKPVKAQDLREMLGREAATAPLGARPSRHRPSLDELRLALQDNQFVVHFQPQVAFADGRYCGAEVLVRWQHPVHGLLYPDCFVEFAEINGLAGELTRCVIDCALPQAVGLYRAGLHGAIAFNLPPVALTDVSFPEQIRALQQQHDAADVELVFELTETSLATNTIALLDILTRLRLRGFSLSIDDFGTGHSSLTMLHQMPFTELKIDLQFVRAAERETSARVIVEKSASMARDLGLQVVAEGVENLALWHWLRRSGCDVAQGYFVGRPMPADRLLEWSRTWSAPADDAA